jgi:tetratricopeptide (TPR) repeat protein
MGTIAETWAAAYYQQGAALLAHGKAVEAAPLFERALQLVPDNPDILCGLGNAYRLRGELDRAVTCYRQALRLAPSYAAEVSNALAIALRELGLLDEAIRQFQETLALRADNTLAYYKLSEFAAEGRYRFPAADHERLQALLAGGRCGTLERSQCCFALAMLLDQQGRYDEAFGHFAQGNNLKKQLVQEAGAAFDAREHHVLIDVIMAAYDARYFEQVPNWGTDADLPVFIVGMPRSGSTLVEQILASHPGVFGAGEVRNIYWFIAEAAGLTHTGQYHPRLVPDATAARRLGPLYLDELARLGKGATRVTVKNLENHLHLGLIATLFPRARIIHCRRDPLDVCLSCYFQNFQDMSFAWSLEDIAAYYRAYEKVMAHWSRVVPAPIHEVRYEDLVHDQEAVSRDLVSFCGLDWDEHCLTFWQTRRAVQTASSLQVRKPMSTRSIGRWHNYRSHLGPLLEALGQPAGGTEA